MPTAEGTLVVAQEQRFQLALAHGGRKLFVLAPGTAVLDRDLHRLARAQARVRVRYRDAPGLVAAIAERLEAAPTTPAGAPTGREGGSER